jgi:hypothetical protein
MAQSPARHSSTESTCTRRWRRTSAPSTCLRRSRAATTARMRSTRFAALRARTTRQIQGPTRTAAATAREQCCSGRRARTTGRGATSGWLASPLGTTTRRLRSGRACQCAPCSFSWPHPFVVGVDNCHSARLCFALAVSARAERIARTACGVEGDRQGNRIRQAGRHQLSSLSVSAAFIADLRVLQRDT